SSNNILIQAGTAKIADFGLSSVLAQMSQSHGYGNSAYKDPASFDSTKRGKESDIFSLGVILWEISSGKIPCEGRAKESAIILCRLKGFRDAPFPGTPNEYIKLN
ncbi:10106_t:CDS:2, partial [Paraglomus occultum]